MPIGWEVTADGVRLDFTEPLDAELAADVESYELEIALTNPGEVSLRLDNVQVGRGDTPLDPERWQPVPGGTWEVVNGAVVGSCTKSEPRHGILLSTFEVDESHRTIKLKGNLLLFQ